MSATTFLRLGFFWCLLSETKTRETYFRSTVIEFNRNYLEDHRMVILPDNVSMNIIYTMAKDQPADAWWKLQIDVQNRRTAKYHHLFQIGPVNHCIQTKSVINKIVLAFIKEFLKKGHISTQCPYKKANYTWLGVSAKSLNMPQMLPGVYRANIISYFQRNGKKDIINNDTINMEVK